MFNTIGLNTFIPLYWLYEPSLTVSMLSSSILLLSEIDVFLNPLIGSLSFLDELMYRCSIISFLPFRA